MYQNIVIVGNLGSDPEMRAVATTSGFVTNFSVAVNNTRNGVKETMWVRVSAWGKLAETCNQYLKKGRKVLVEGRLVFDPTTGGPRVYTKHDGGTAASFEVMASEVKFLDAAPAATGAGEPVEPMAEIPFN